MGRDRKKKARSRLSEESSSSSSSSSSSGGEVKPNDFSMFDDEPDMEKQDPLAPLTQPSSQKSSERASEKSTKPRSFQTTCPFPPPGGPKRTQSRVPGAGQPGTHQQRPQGQPGQEQSRGQPGQPGQERPPGPPRTTSQQQRDKNPRFKDLEKTGRWGNISRTEMIVGGAILLLMVGGAIAVVLVFVVFKDTGPAVVQPTLPPTAAPSQRPEVDPEVQVPAIYSIVSTNPFTNTSLPSKDASFYTPALIDDASQTPSVRSMSWIINDDPRDLAPENPFLVWRYALTTIYYSLGGPNWRNSSGWLTEEHSCDWYGVNCDRFHNRVLEVDLASNNLQGTLPNELALLTDLRSLVLKSNQLTGTVPVSELGSLPSLSILFLDDNKLSGDLELFISLRDNGVLSTLMIQANNITGRFPRDFCPRTGDPPVLNQFGLDCSEETRCLCCEPDNCF